MLDSPATITGALDQFGCHHKCSSTVDSGHHSLRWCHVLLSLTDVLDGGFVRVCVLCRICASAKAALGDWFSSAVWNS